MSPRRYTLRQRAEAQEVTRQRILDATRALHLEQGALGTSVRQVAGRAGVSPATVLAHFPDVDRLVGACGQYSAEVAPFPSPARLAGLEGAEARLGALVRACADYWERSPGLERLYLERRALPALDRAMGLLDDAHEALCAEALRPLTRSARALRLARMLTGVSSWRALRAQGLTPEAAADDLLTLLLAWLRQGAAPQPRAAARAARAR